MASCPRCGASIDEASKSCGNCGADASQAAQAASPMLAPQTQTQPQSAGMKQNVVAVLFYAGMIIGLFGLVLPVIFLIINLTKRFASSDFMSFKRSSSICFFG